MFAPTALRPRDPAESWEIRFTETEGGSYFRAERTSYPRTPRRVEDIPAGAKESLEETCGFLSLEQLFVIPFAVRSIGWRGNKVISPSSVLALGDQAVGLWTEKPTAGVKLTIPLDRVAAIEDVTVLLYGRLSFVPFGDWLTIRYNTVARRDMEPSLLELRKRLAGAAEPLPPAEQTAFGLPFKWKVILDRLLVRLEKDLPVRFSFATVPARSRHEPGQRQLLVMNPFELVYACDPTESTQLYGVDSYIIPRSRIAGGRIQGNSLEVSSNGARITIPMEGSLREAALRWLGSTGDQAAGLPAT